MLEPRQREMLPLRKRGLAGWEGAEGCRIPGIRECPALPLVEPISVIVQLSRHRHAMSWKNKSESSSVLTCITCYPTFFTSLIQYAVTNNPVGMFVLWVMLNPCSRAVPHTMDRLTHPSMGREPNSLGWGPNRFLASCLLRDQSRLALCVDLA